MGDAVTQVYSDPARATDPHALPDIEVFEVTANDTLLASADDTDIMPEGWYWWACFPGCLPDGDWHGPFPTEAQAITDVRQQ